MQTPSFSWDQFVLRGAAALAAVAGIVSAVAIVGIVHTGLAGIEHTVWFDDLSVPVAMLLAAIATWYSLRRTLSGAAWDGSDGSRRFPVAPRLSRLVLALLSGGCAATVFVAIATTTVAIVSGDTMGCMGRWAAIRFAMTIGVLVTAYVAVLAAIVFVLPFYFLSRRYGFASARAYAILGACIAIIALVLPELIVALQNDSLDRFVGPDDATTILLALTAALLDLMVFWLIARPDRGARESVP